jgi:hypothetical protein
MGLRRSADLTITTHVNPAMVRSIKKSQETYLLHYLSLPPKTSNRCASAVSINKYWLPIDKYRPSTPVILAPVLTCYLVGVSPPYEVSGKSVSYEH